LPYLLKILALNISQIEIRRPGEGVFLGDEGAEGFGFGEEFLPGGVVVHGVAAGFAVRLAFVFPDMGDGIEFAFGGDVPAAAFAEEFFLDGPGFVFIEGNPSRRGGWGGSYRCGYRRSSVFFLRRMRGFVPWIGRLVQIVVCPKNVIVTK
jgi:hypothetical protein